MITGAELAAVDVGNLEQAIARLRPEFLRSRNPSMRDGFGKKADVYLDDHYYGGLETLAQIPRAVVREVRLVSAVESSVRFVGVHPGGTIIVRTR